MISDKTTSYGLEEPKAAEEGGVAESGETSIPNQTTVEVTATSRDETVSDHDMSRVLARLRRRVLDTYHHRPGRLWVGVNGIPVGSLDIHSKKNELSVTTRVEEPLKFIEVFSEQEIRLAMLNLDADNGGSVERKARISLSDKRKLRINFTEGASGLKIRLGYTDPEIEGWERLATLGLYQEALPTSEMSE